MLESLAAIATAITAIIGVVAYYRRKAKAAAAQRRADLETSIAHKIATATTDEERRKYVMEQDALRNGRR